jgi:hypothetical protein
VRQFATLFVPRLSWGGETGPPRRLAGPCGDDRANGADTLPAFPTSRQCHRKALESEATVGGVEPGGVRRMTRRLRYSTNADASAFMRYAFIPSCWVKIEMEMEVQIG